jgi:hypothetical protein
MLFNQQKRDSEENKNPASNCSSNSMLQINPFSSCVFLVLVSGSRDLFSQDYRFFNNKKQTPFSHCWAAFDIDQQKIGKVIAVIKIQETEAAKYHFVNYT